MSDPSTSANLPNGRSDDKVKMVKTKWENFENWLHCICIVTFDLELGQAVEVNI